MSNRLPDRYALQCVLVFIAYYVAGRLALLLAIPPGYATAIWPAAGVALAGCLLFGSRVWPAVALASLMVNIDTAIEFDAGLAGILDSVQLPLWIAAGAALQAVVGAALTKRYVQAPLCLDNLGSVWRFVVIVCALASLISPTIGVMSLQRFGALGDGNFFYTWSTWWVGDALGVLVVSVLLFVFFAEPRDIWSSRRQILPPVLVATSLVMVMLYVTASQWEQERQQAEFDRRSNHLYQLMRNAFERYWEALHGLQATFAFEQPRSQADFEQLVSGFIDRNPGIQGVTWTIPVSADEKSGFERALSADYGGNIVVTQLDSNGIQMAAAEDRDFVAIRFIAPIERNRSALGFDVSSNPVARLALFRARDTGRAAATDPVTLVQETGSQSGIVVYFPVVQIGQTATDTALASRIVGYVAGVFRLGDLVHSVLPDSALDGLSLRISMRQGDQALPMLSVNQPPSALTAQTNLLSRQWFLDFADRQWQLDIKGHQQFLADSRSLMPWAMLATGMLFVGLLGMSLLVLTGQHFRARQTGKTLEEMLSALRDTQNQLVEAEKMASLGGMVAGFAHELNTPVGIVVTAISTLQNDLKAMQEQLDSASDPEEYRGKLDGLLRRAGSAADIVLASAQKTAGLVSSFKQVSVDQNASEAHDINMREYLDDLLVHLEASCRRNGHTLVWECPRDLAIVSVPSGITQVIYNLVQNSLDHAFPQGVKGRINVSVEAASQGIRINYRDDGVGIESAELVKIFEPFYTTRRNRGGKGLGLHLVYNIVRQQLRGRIAARSAVGEGVEFTIELPASIATQPPPQEKPFSLL